MDFKEGDPSFLENDNKWVHTITADQIKLGTLLNNAHYIIQSKTEIKGLIDFHCYAFKYHFYIIENFIPLNNTDLSNTKLTTLNGLSLENLPKVQEYLTGSNGCWTIEFLAGNSNQNDDFGELVGAEDNSFKRLGFLRMDVDNLGSLFKNALPDVKNLTTWVDYTQLSYSLDLFFKGHLNHVSQNEIFKKRLHIIYAGGDDVCIVGKWDKTILFAKTIHEELQKYSNHTLTISGGMAIAEAKFPTQKAIELAADLEHQAKSHDFNGIAKNSFNFFDMPLHWSNQEFDAVWQIKEDILKYLKTNALVKNFIQKMNTINNLRINHPNQVKWMWMLTYDIARNHNSKNIELDTYLEIQKNKMINFAYQNNNRPDTGYHYCELFSFACTWAYYEHKS